MKNCFLIILFIFFSKFGLAQISFASYQILPTGSWPEVVVIADMNNDGLNDVVLGTGYFADPINDYKLFIFYQNSIGNLDQPVTYSYPQNNQGLRAISAGDLNNDQLTDIVIGFGDSIGVFYQNASGSLNNMVAYYSGALVDGVKIGDLNNDGLNDIAVSQWNDLFIKVFYQNSSGFTSAMYPKTQGGYGEIDIGDLNNDGLNDIVHLQGSYSSNIEIYHQKTTGGFYSPVNYCATVAYPLRGIGIGDLDNDGRNDIAVSKGGNNPDCTMYLLFQDSLTGLMNGPDSVNTYDIPIPVEIADLNCDGRNEIVALHSGWLNASVYEQDSSNHFNAYQLFSLPYAQYWPQTLSIGDINNDGRKDVAVADYNHGLVLLYNTTLPANLNVTDTLYAVDTVNTSIWIKPYYYESITVIDDKKACMVRNVDSFEVSQTFEIHKIRTDSLFERTGAICAHLYIDTVTSSTFRTDTSLVAQDTSYMSTTIDTVFSEPILDFSLEKNAQLYPVPTNNVITIALTNPCYSFYRNTQAMLEIYNDKGSKVFTLNTFTNDFPLNISLSNYACGLYFLRCSADGGGFTKKIIKVN